MRERQWRRARREGGGWRVRVNGERTVVTAPVLVFQRVALAILLLKLFVQDLEELCLRQLVQIRANNQNLDNLVLHFVLR